MYYDVDNSEFKVTTHTHTKKQKKKSGKQQAMSMMSLNLTCFQIENHCYHDVTPSIQKPVSHTYPE